jgi:iron complex outermembrane receptor protein
VEVDAQSAQALNRTGKLWLPGRALVNLGVTGRPWRRADVALSLEARNLLDVSTQDLDGYPLPSRALYLTLSAAWEAAPPQRPHEEHASRR